MRTLIAALFLAASLSAAPYDQIDCWMINDTIALGGQAFAVSIYNGSADTAIWMTQTIVNDTTAVSNYFPIAATATLTTFTGLQAYAGVTTLYASWADSAGVGDTIYIWCWGYDE